MRGYGDEAFVHGSSCQWEPTTESSSSFSQRPQAVEPRCLPFSYDKHRQCASQETYAGTYSWLSTHGLALALVLDWLHLHFPLGRHRLQITAKIFPWLPIDVALEPFQPLEKAKKALTEQGAKKLGTRRPEAL